MKNEKKVEGLEKEGHSVLYYYDDIQNSYIYGKLTICIIVKDGKLVSRGTAYCSKKDCFVKKLGRNIALGRAIQNMGAKHLSPSQFEQKLISYTLPKGEVMGIRKDQEEIDPGNGFRILEEGEVIVTGDEIYAFKDDEPEEWHWEPCMLIGLPVVHAKIRRMRRYL